MALSTILQTKYSTYPPISLSYKSPVLTNFLNVELYFIYNHPSYLPNNHSLTMKFTTAIVASLVGTSTALFDKNQRMQFHPHLQRFELTIPAL